MDSLRALFGPFTSPMPVLSFKVAAVYLLETLSGEGSSIAHSPAEELYTTWADSVFVFLCPWS